MTGGTLFERLKAACPREWEAYTRHRFVRELGAGTLPEASFRHYLGQDYLFLIHFARAYALAVYKADTLEDMRRAARSVSVLLDTEMNLHVRFCAGWGMTEAEMAALPEEPATIAYTRFVLERGMAGDLLDLHVALVPCVIGYAEIGRWLADDPATKRAGNPYLPWIEMYAGEEYGEVARGAVEQLDRLMTLRAGEGRFESLARTFRQATVAEIAFWDMGLNPPA
ncbi:MAG: thiaminase II [Alphaproteobacteria bacterium]